MTRTSNLTERRYDLDWLRVIAILILHLFHVGMFFVPWQWHLKNNQTSDFMAYIMVFSHQWRMPLLLFISGAGTIFASSRRNNRAFCKERSKRLLIPLIFAIFVIVPPQIYFERIDNFNSYLDFYPTVYEFIPYPMGGSFSWHHMWFVLYLFCYSMIALPLMHFLKSERSNKFLLGIEKYLSHKWAVFSYVSILIVIMAVLLPLFPEETHSLIDDWAFFTYYFAFFIAGMLTASSDRIWDILRENRRFNLLLAIISLIALEILFALDWKILQTYMFFDLVILWYLLKIMVAWTWVVAIIGYGRAYLNRNSKFLKYANEGIYPFYILHQTVIIALAFPMINWDRGIALKYIVLTSVTFTATVLIYHFLVRPFNLTRLLFGMKLRTVGVPKETTVPKNIRSAGITVEINKQQGV